MKPRKDQIGDNNIKMECGIAVVTRYLEFEQLDMIGLSPSQFMMT
jgi:hypothetical protein